MNVGAGVKSGLQERAACLANGFLQRAEGQEVLLAVSCCVFRRVPEEEIPKREGKILVFDKCCKFPNVSRDIFSFALFPPS